MSTPSPVAAAPRQLADLVAAMRPDWDRVQIDGAIAAARNAGWTFTRTAREIVRMACDPAATPSDLAAALRDPLHRAGPRHVLDPSADVPEYARAREELAARQPAVEVGDGGTAA